MYRIERTLGFTPRHHFYVLTCEGKRLGAIDRLSAVKDMAAADKRYRLRVQLFRDLEHAYV